MSPLKRCPSPLSRLFLLLSAAVFAVGALRAGGLLLRYRADRLRYRRLSRTYTAAVPAPSPDAVPLPEAAASPAPETSPRDVDFALLREELGPDAAAWLFCPDTVLDYPVMYRCQDGLYYLDHDAAGSPSGCGALFIDSTNFPDLRDRHTVVHGHHLADGSMLGSLGRWADPDYFRLHRVLYLNAPGGNYRVDLIAYRETPAGSDAYRIDFFGEEDLAAWVRDLQDRALCRADYVFRPGDRFLSLSTCMYSFENARGVLTGVLRPLSGG